MQGWDQLCVDGVAAEERTHKQLCNEGMGNLAMDSVVGDFGAIVEGVGKEKEEAATQYTAHPTQCTSIVGFGLDKSI